MTAIREFAKKHPLILAWVALAIGMVAMLLVAARDVGLQPGQMTALVVSTVVLAGLCVWIISWE